VSLAVVDGKPQPGQPGPLELQPARPRRAPLEQRFDRCRDQFGRPALAAQMAHRDAELGRPAVHAAAAVDGAE
jgi:hypothetical protein